MTEKLAKYLARCGVASRRACEDYIRAGWVRVNGEIICTPETRINPDEARVNCRDKLVLPPRAFRYILINKPVGVICTCRPSREKGKTIMDLVKVPERIYPAGRLDRDTSGLLLLTNDGDLVQKLTHPSFQQEREYLIETERPIRDQDQQKLTTGVMLEDGLSRFLKVEKQAARRLKIILAEGRKRQIRRTFAAIGLPIINLHRVRIGTLRLTWLPPGAWRDLTSNEIRRLKA